MTAIGGASTAILRFAEDGCHRCSHKTQIKDINDSEEIFGARSDQLNGHIDQESMIISPSHGSSIEMTKQERLACL